MATKAKKADKTKKAAKEKKPDAGTTIIRAIIQNPELNAEQVAEKLSKAGLNAKPSTIGAWKHGVTKVLRILGKMNQSEIEDALARVRK